MIDKILLDKNIEIDSMFNLLEKISGTQRMINSSGIDESFKLIKKDYDNIRLIEFPCGEKCDDWIVPPSWAVEEGIMQNKNGDIIASIELNSLFVAANSENVEGWFTKKIISEHLTTRKDNPDAFILEHRNAYNFKLVDWGISLPYNLWNNLPDEEYYIKIAVKWDNNSSMKIGESFIRGKSSKTICFIAHIDELCNDDISGCVVGLNLFKHLNNVKENLNYSYLLLIVPETIGTFFYVNKKLNTVKNIIGVVDLETVGAGDNLCVKKSLQETSWIDKILLLAVIYLKLDFKVLSFFEGYGNDERVFNWPTLNIPSTSILRYPFKEYHTSDDTPNIINKGFLFEVLDICLNIVKICEHDYVPQYNNIIPPWLSKRDLYYDSINQKEKFHKFNNLLLFNIDGIKPVSELCEITKLEFWEVHSYLEKFYQQNCINKKYLYEI